MLRPASRWAKGPHMYVCVGVDVLISKERSGGERGGGCLSEVCSGARFSCFLRLGDM